MIEADSVMDALLTQNLRAETADAQLREAAAHIGELLASPHNSREPARAGLTAYLKTQGGGR